LHKVRKHKESDRPTSIPAKLLIALSTADGAKKVNGISLAFCIITYLVLQSLLTNISESHFETKVQNEYEPKLE